MAQFSPFVLSKYPPFFGFAVRFSEVRRLASAGLMGLGGGWPYIALWCHNDRALCWPAREQSGDRRRPERAYLAADGRWTRIKRKRWKKGLSNRGGTRLGYGVVVRPRPDSLPSRQRRYSSVAWFPPPINADGRR